MYLMFSKLRMERLDLENPQVDAVVERPVSSKRRAQNDKGTVNKAKKPRRNELIPVQNVIEPGIEEVDGGSTSLNIPRIENKEEMFHNYSTFQEITLESSNLSSERVRIEVLGKSDRDILRLFQENWHKIILCNGYIMTSNNNNYRYKLNIKFLSEKFRKNCVREILKSIDFYKEEKIIVLGTLTKFTLYKLENNDWTKKEYDIPPIKLYYRVRRRRLGKLTRDQYSIELSIVGDTILFVYRVIEGVECLMANFGDSNVWLNPINRKNFLKTLLYSVMDGSILLDTNILTKFTKVNNEWINKYQVPFYLRHYAEDGFGEFIPIYMSNVTATGKTAVNYTIDYTNVSFDLVKYREKIIWRRQPGQSIPNPVLCYAYRSSKLTFQFDDKFITYVLEGNELIEKHHHIPPVTLLSQDNDGNTTPLCTDDYSLKLSLIGAVIFIYTLSTEICTQIRYSDRIIWNLEPGENKPLHVIYSQETGRLEIIFEDKILFTNSKNPNSIVQTIKIPPELTLHKRNDQGETVKLSLEEYRVQTFEKTGLRYIPNDDIICTELRNNGTIVWNYRDGDQKPLSFNYYFKTKKIITVTFHSKPSLHYELQHDQ